MLRNQLTHVINEWNDHVYMRNRKQPFTDDVLNTFIQKHEDVLVAYGNFMDGLRVKTGLVDAHECFNGVLGIVSMSVARLKIKANGICGYCAYK